METSDTTLEFDDPPIPFGRLLRLPTFPVDLLPSWQADFVKGLSVAMQTPVDLAGVMVLSVTAAAAGGRAVVEVRPGWREPVNLYVAVGMEPGSRKSPVVARVLRPVTRAEEALIDSTRPLMVEALTKRKAAQQKADLATAAAGRDDAKMADAIDAAAMVDAIEIPALPRLLADDATVEALGSLLVDHRGRIAVLSAEGGGVFDIAGGRYSKTPNVDVYLKAHVGDPLRVDRKGRPPEYVASPALTLGLAVQPIVLANLSRQPGFRGRGLLDRFLFTLPTDTVGSRKVGAEPLPDDVGELYDTQLETLAASMAGWDDPAVLGFSAEANEVMLAYERRIEPRLGHLGDLAHVRGWGAKLAGHVARIAGLLHLAEHLTEGVKNKQITAETVERAIVFGDYFTAHALTVFDLMDVDPVIADARVVGKWALEHRPTFTRRDAHRAHEARFPKVTDIDPVLTLLELHDWIRRLEPPESGPKGGRPPSPSYAVNPHNPSTEPTQPTQPLGSVASVGSVEGPRG